MRASGRRSGGDGGPRRSFGARFRQESYGAVKDADGLVIVTEWDEFRGLDLDRFASTMRGKLIVDLRNVYNRGGRRGSRLGLHRSRPRARSMLEPRLKLVRNGPEADAKAAR